MATEKPYILPQGQQLTSEIITNLYLYNQPTTPTDEELLNSDLIRPILNISNIPNGAETISDIPQDIELVNAYVDAEPYMASGAGRFANGSQFDLVRAFFGLGKDQMLTDKGRDNLLEDVVLEPGTYTKENIDDLLFQGTEAGKGLDGFSSSIELRNYRDTLNDYDELVYIWNSTAFSIPNNAQFVVNPDGTKEIRNFRIEPNAFPTLKNKENFDFETANPVVEIGSGLILEPRVDPSGIGRTVYIDFYNRGNLSIYDPVDENESAGVYNLIDFNADLARERLFYQPNFFGVIEPVLREAEKLFDAGVTKFLYQNKPILYGTVDADVLSATDDINAAYTPTLFKFEDNGTVLIGGEGDDVLGGEGAIDILIGGDGQDTLTGFNGEDILEGGKGDDQLRGGGDRDIAIFSDNFENYDYSISDGFLGLERIITLSHVRGTQKDGTDTLEDIEWAEFGREQVDTGTLVASSSLDGISIATEPRLIPLPLTDGVESTEFVEVESTVANPNPNDPPTPPIISLTAPVAMLDGDVDYTLNISPYQPDTEYNVVYVIDTSISIDATELQTIQNAYTDLTNFYINEGIAENINFGVVSYDSSGRFYTDSSGDINLTADEAIAALQNLTIDTRIGTRYYDGLNRADQFLLNSPKNPFETTGIGYFITDGQNSGDRFDMLLKARDVRELANFQAIGYYTDLNSLSSNSLQIRDINWIDSNQGVFIDDISDLSTELLKSDLADDLELVNILLDGEIVETITPEQLTDNPLGLTYEGSVDGLDVSIDAENIITAEVVFTDESNFATTTLDFTVTAGESEAVDGEGNDIAQTSDDNEDPFERMLDGGDSDDKITLGYADRGANGGAGGDYIIGNRRDNILDGGAGNDTISAYEGNDRITTGSGRDKVDGGSGIDTVIYNDETYQDNNISLSKAGNSVSYNNTDTLTNVEFIQLSDVRFSTDTLEVTPVVEVADLSISEGDSDLTTAQLDFNLSTPAPVDISFDYSSEDIGSATAGSDYTATSGTITIPAGETSVSLNLEIIGDTEDEEIETFALNYSALKGATFSNNRTEYSTVVTIENAILPLVLNGDDNDNLLEGDALEDSISGGSGNDTLRGLAGNDTLIGGFDNDVLNGGVDDDSLYGGSGSDILWGDNGQDRLEGEDGDDYLYGGNDNDRAYGGNGQDVIYGEGGNDWLRGVHSHDTLYGGEGNDTLYGDNGRDRLEGEDGDDYLYGGNDNDRAYGGNGEDRLEGKDGDDYLYGGNDNDRAYGGNGQDVIYGEGGNDWLRGVHSHDTLYGGEGNDTLFGDNGTDLLIGEDGDDTFGFNTNVAFNSQNLGVDVIHDFGDGNDVINLGRTTFTALSSRAGTGFSNPQEFAVVSQDEAVVNSDAYILYSSSTGNLFYNENGAEAGLGNGGHFATLNDAPELIASNFTLSD